MTTHRLNTTGTEGGAPFVLHLLSTFWGVAVLLVLGGYTLTETLTYESSVQLSQERSASSPSSSAVPFVPSGPFPDVQQEPMIIHIACSQQDASQVRTPPGRYPFTMRLDQVPEDIRALLRGTDTVFPKNARIVMTPCMQALVENGEFP